MALPVVRKAVKKLPNHLCQCSCRYASSSSSAPSLGGKPYRIAVCGAGPSGFYATSRLLALQGSEGTHVDLFEQLPTPFGLSRYGVAPDHPEVKNCEHKFEETAQDPRFRFFGNAQLSSPASTGPSVPNLSFAGPRAVQLPLETLRATYDAVLLTYGASLDRLLDVPGENDLLHVLSARTFVNWYNGHPFASPANGAAPLLDLSSTERVVVVGQGNVALDVARVLLTPIDELAKTDMADYALAELARSRVKKVEIVGRRGPLQIACTTKEVREMMNLPSVAFHCDSGLLSDAAAIMNLPEGSALMEDARMKRRLLQLMQKGSKARPSEASKEWSFEFLRSPLAFYGGRTDSEATLDKLVAPRAVSEVLWQENEMIVDGNASPSDWSAKSKGPKHRYKTRADLVLKSVGYRSVGLPLLPFDDRRGVVRNIDGRVVDDGGRSIPGLYVSGWLSRGPTGVIATTMYDAYSVAETIALDLQSRPPVATKGADIAIEDLVSDSARLVTWDAWRRIDSEERRRGAVAGRPREKITSIDELLTTAVG